MKTEKGKTQRKTVTKPKATVKKTETKKTSTAKKTGATKKPTAKKSTTKKAPAKKAASKPRTSAKPKAVTKVKVKTKAEQLCDSVIPELKAQAITLANAVLTMQEKIEQQIPNYKKADLAQKVIVGTGEEMLRQNPLVQEFRATVRDYSAALNNLEEMLEKKKAEPEQNPLDALRSRFGVG